MRLIARPIDSWPGEMRRSHDRTRSPFSATWQRTVNDLDREVTAISDGRADEVVLQMAITERDCRLDGWIRADARPAHPGVIVSFESKHGPMRMAVDRYDDWRANVRAVGLTLAALRAIDRYGVATSGEQYRGWQALPPGQPFEAGAAMTVEQAARLLYDAATPFSLEVPWSDVVDSPRTSDLCYRHAAKRAHPDTGGTDDEMARLSVAYGIVKADQVRRGLR